MPTYQINSITHLDKFEECYKKIIVINQKPIGPLANLIRTITKEKLSPFQTTTSCCPVAACTYAILNPNHTTQLLCSDNIADLFSFLLTNGYTIQYELTKIMQQSHTKNLICYITI